VTGATPGGDGDRRLTPRRARLLAVGVAAAVGLVVFAVAADVFPYHSVNDDEGVYLTQAAMLLEGQLALHPGPLAPSVRPWFFVADPTPTGVRYYSKYAPVAPAVFAAGLAIGVPRAALGAVAAGTAGLVYVLGSEAFDRPTGLVAAAGLVASPLFVFTSAVFLSYAPTTLLNLGFAVAYVRAHRVGKRIGDAAVARRRTLVWAGLAGAAAGFAFFSRPFTAVLFAAPFITHTLVRVGRAVRRGEVRPALPVPVVVAAVGLAVVGTRLWYNAVMTGSPLVFPYEAFGPQDGIGFGERALLGYEETFTPALAVESTVEAVRMYAREWGPAGVVGTVLAVGGLASLSSRAAGASADRDAFGGAGLSDREVRAVLAGVAVAVVVGETYFWGTLNGLRNGLIDLLGPYYHFDLLVPTCVFAAAAACQLARLTRAHLGPERSRGRRAVFASVLVVGAAVTGAAAVDGYVDPLSENRERTEVLEETYAPFDRSFDHALVFVPPAYGDWLSHPFQHLRNGPGYDGDVVYAVDGPPDEDLQVVAATADRTAYRFTYRGEWTGATTPVTPTIQRLRVLESDRVSAETTVGVPAGARSASIRIETDEGYARYQAATEGERLRVAWRVGADGARVTNRPRAYGPAAVPVPEGASEVSLAVTFVGVAGASVTYRQEASVDRDGDVVRVIWPPETRVCRLTTDCGQEGTWVGERGTYVDGVSVETSVRAGSPGSANATATATATATAGA
jgi:hypothetical protein